MKTNINQFLKKFKAHQQLSLDASAKAINKTLLALYKKIVDRTPVGDPSLWSYPAPAGYEPGTLKASWKIVFNSNGSGRDSSTGRFTSIKQAAGQGGISFKVGKNKQQNALIYNNEPYAQRVETGWSSQAPTGMMRITVAEFQAIFNIQAKINKVR